VQEVRGQSDEERVGAGSSVGLVAAQYSRVRRVRVGRHRSWFGRHHDQSRLHAMYATFYGFRLKNNRVHARFLFRTRQKS